MIVKLLTEHHLENLSLKGGCRGSSEPTPVKMPHCWKSHVAAHLFSLGIKVLTLTVRLSALVLNLRHDDNVTFLKTYRRKPAMRKLW